MKTAVTNGLKASLAVIAGWTVAGWFLFLMVGLFALITQG